MPGGSALPRRDAVGSSTLADSAKVVGWGLVFWAATEYVASAFARNATAALAIEAALAEWAAGRIGIAWSDPLAREPTSRDLARRAGVGAALGTGCVALVVGVSLAVGAARNAGASFGGGLLAIGLVTAILGAVRDELLLRGVVLRATRGLLPWWGGLLACGAAAMTARLGVEDAIGLGLVAHGLRGVALGALWTRDRGAWIPIAANATWTWVLGSVVSGGVLDVRFVDGRATELVGVLVAGAAAIGATAWARARRTASPGDQ